MLPFFVLLAQTQNDPLDRVGHGGIVSGSDVIIIGGVSNNTNKFLDSVYKVSPSTGLLTEHQSLPEPKAFAATALFRGKLYVIGGLTTGGTPTKSTHYFDTETGQWERGPDFPTTISRATATVFGNYLYVVGGIIGPDSSPENSNSVWRMDRRTLNWNKMPDLPDSLHGHAAVVFGRSIYLIGGYAGKEMKQTAQVLWSDSRNRWEQAEAMPEPRGFASAVVFGDGILVFGNRGPSTAPIRFDDRQRKWFPLKLADTQRHRAFPALIGNQLWLIGGEGAPGSLQRFDLPQSNR